MLRVIRPPEDAVLRAPSKQDFWAAEETRSADRARNVAGPMRLGLGKVMGSDGRLTMTVIGAHWAVMGTHEGINGGSRGQC